MGKAFDIPISKLLAPSGYVPAGVSDITVSGIAYSSRDVTSGDVFFCVPGTVTDGHVFAPDAVRRGASALVVEHPLKLDIPQFVVEDSRKALALAADVAFDHPSRHLSLVGVTGTNGKTTTTYLVEQVLRSIGRTTGLIGTVETRIAGHRHPSSRTTPESLDLQELFSDMVDQGVTDAVMEVSSHAIDLGRIEGTHFTVAAFSQLTQDHLDYHKTMENYYQAKRRLFFDHDVDRSVVCIDDAYGKRLADEIRAAGHGLITCGFDRDADVRAEDVACGPLSTTLRIETAHDSATLQLPLVGSYNVDNALLATAICLASDIPLSSIASALEDSPQVPGRLERVHADVERPFCVFVDYAHTPDAIAKATAVVKDITPGKVIIVFGCGGDRDATKRPRMGRAALAADHVVVTSDNPRSEDPDAIISDILPGMAGDEERFEVEPDRRRAIARALRMAQPGDSVLIAGKGHEDYQLVGDSVLPFDDRVVAREEMERLS